MLNKIKKNFLKFYDKYRFNIKWKKELENINKKKFIIKKTILDEKQKEEIQKVFVENYGENFSDDWHKLYQAYTGKYDKLYFPEILFSTKLEDILNPKDISNFLEDKSFVELLYGNVKNLKLPNTIVLNCSGIYYSNDRKIISYKDALKLIFNTDEVVFKTTINSCSGRSIMMCKFKNGIEINSKKTAEEVIKIYEKNFIIQECIKNCKELSALHPSSINTFRIMTYTIDGKIYHVPLALRIGRNGNRVDNAHAGGMFIGVTDDGYLASTAFTEYDEEFIEHPDSHIKFENYYIPGVKKIIDMAYKCHGLTPHLGMISWDFTIDENNEIVLIEVNTTGQSIWFPQMANGCGAFGKNTFYMYKLISKSGKGDMNDK